MRSRTAGEHLRGSNLHPRIPSGAINHQHRWTCKVCKVYPTLWPTYQSDFRFTVSRKKVINAPSSQADCKQVHAG